MTNEWGENKPSSKLTKRLSEPPARSAASIGKGNRRIRGAGRAMRAIRRHPVGAASFATGAGVLLATGLAVGLMMLFRNLGSRGRLTSYLH